MKTTTPRGGRGWLVPEHDEQAPGEDDLADDEDAGRGDGRRVAGGREHRLDGGFAPGLAGGYPPRLGAGGDEYAHFFLPMRRTVRRFGGGSAGRGAGRVLHVARMVMRAKKKPRREPGLSG